VTLWRISRYADLSGRGGLYASGRWHTRGTSVVYLSDHPSTCLLEMLVQVGDAGDMPTSYQWLAVDATGVAATDVQALPAEWAASPVLTQALGDDWLATGATALLRVPAVVAPATTNYLLNPRHPDARRCRVRDVVAYPVDGRLAHRLPVPPDPGRERYDTAM